MRPTSIHKLQALTRIELIVVIVVIVLLMLIVPAIISPVSAPGAHGPRITCVNNLRQIGMAYFIWANDHNQRFPALESVTNGGWSDLLTNADQGPLCWTNYAIMANELGQLPKLLVCPSDERKPAGYLTNTSSIDTDLKNNGSLSYFVGVSASDSHPQSLLAGDRNLCGGTKPSRDYGFSPENGLGNDVAIQTNSKAAPVCWSLKMHSAGNTNGAGNTLLGDGSGQEVNSAGFSMNWQPNFSPTTNWPAGHVPSAPSIRVLFP